MGNKSSKKKTTNIDNVTTVMKKCQRCKSNISSHVRKIAITKVPPQYILSSDNVCYDMVLSNVNDRNFQIDLINLPKKLAMTKYNYYVCDECHEIELPTTLEWNFWTKLD